MADGVEWFFKLIDQMTGPAKAITTAVAGVGSATKGVDDTVGKSTGSVTSNIGAMAVASGTFLADMAEKALDVGLSFAKFGADLVLSGAAFAAKSADFKRNTLFSLQSMLGAGADARATLDQLEGYAQRTGMAKDDFTKFATRALGAGFSKDELRPILGAVSDIRAANGGDAAAGEELFNTLQILKDNAKKGINPRELATLGRLGISPDKIYGIIAAQKNVTLAQAKALAEGGGVKGQDALVAVLQTVRGMNAGGKLGGIGEAFQAGSLTAQIQHVKDAIGDLFENVDIKPLTDFLGKINAGLSGGGMAKIQGMINGAFSGLVGWLSKISLDDVINGFQTVARVLKSVWDFGVGVVQVGKAWGAAFSSAFASFMPAIEKMGSFFTGPDGKGTTDWLDGTIATVKVLGEIGGATFGFMVVVVETFVLALVKTYQGIVTAVDGIKAAFNGLMAIGTNLVEGIWSGITGAWASMMQRFHGLVEMLPASVKKILGIASPSKVFADLGMQTGRGFTMGLDATDLSGAMNDAVAPPSPSSVTIADIAGKNASAPAGQTFSVTFNLHTDGSTNAQKAGEQIKDEMERVILPAMITAFEQLKIEMGG